MKPNLPLRPDRLAVVVIALAAAALSLGFFSPRFAYWRLLRVSLPGTTAEVIRAQVAIQQIEHPFAEVANDVNRVLHWRLFFPVLAHLLHLPPAVYLALPHAGALLALGFVAWLLRRQGVGRWTTFAATAVAATCTWFFVSLGWLGYFDSWLILGLLVAIFSAGPGPALAAVLITPWIDERFVLLLPLAFLARREHRRTAGLAPDAPRALRSAGVVLAALSPWLAIRLGSALFTHDQTTAGYLGGWLARQSEVPLDTYVLGTWEGLRGGWVFVGALFFLEWRGEAGSSAALLPVFLVTLLVNVFIALDVGRSASAFLPLALLGTLAWWRRSPRGCAIAAGACLALNLALPATQVTGAVTWRIRNFAAEWHDWNTPPPELTSEGHLGAAIAALNQGRIEQAIASATTAIALAPENGYAHAARSTAYFRLNRLPEALADADAAVRSEPHNPVFLNNRGRIRAELGDVRGGIVDLEQVLREPAATDDLKRQVAPLLEQLRRR